jgi:hypothetical protein
MLDAGYSMLDKGSELFFQHSALPPAFGRFERRALTLE